jgi:hypothetical protein
VPHQAALVIRVGNGIIPAPSGQEEGRCVIGNSGKRVAAAVGPTAGTEEIVATVERLARSGTIAGS